MKEYSRLINALNFLEFYGQMINGQNELSEMELVFAKREFRKWKKEYLKLHSKIFKEEIKLLNK